MDKKGITSAYVTRWFITILVMVYPFYLVLSSIVDIGTSVSLSTNNLENYLLLNRLFYSTNGFFYHDQYTGRTNFEIVDITKFNEETLRNLFGEEGDNTKISLKLVIGGQELYYNKFSYDFIEEVHAQSEKHDMITKNKIVLVRYPDEREEKKLLIVKIGFEKE